MRTPVIGWTGVPVGVAKPSFFDRKSQYDVRWSSTCGPKSAGFPSASYLACAAVEKKPLSPGGSELLAVSRWDGGRSAAAAVAGAAPTATAVTAAHTPANQAARIGTPSHA